MGYCIKTVQRSGRTSFQVDISLATGDQFDLWLESEIYIMIRAVRISLRCCLSCF